MMTAETRRPVGRPVTDPERNTRTLLLDAAAELFAELGVAATTFAMIARRAHLTPAMVHYHFDTREELLDAVVDERLLAVIEYVWHPINATTPPEEALRGLVDRLIDQIAQAPWVPSIWMREVLNEGGLLRERLFRKLPFDKVRLVGEGLARGQQARSVNPAVDPLLTVFSALGLVMLHMATLNFWANTFHRPVLTKSQMKRHITGLLLSGVRTWPPQPSSSPDLSVTKTNRRRT